MMIPRNTRRTQSPEHGDWRVSVSHPEEVEHLVNPPLSMWKKMQLRVEYLQSQSGAYWAQDDYAEDDVPVVPISGWPKILRIIIAVCVLLPLSVVMVFALLMQLYHAAPTVSTPAFWLSEPIWYTLLGACTFLAMMIARVFEPVLVYVYVLGHELTHAIAAKLCFGHVRDFKIDFDGGYVETDTDNLFIALAPYFVPLWMLFWLGALWVVNFCYPFEAYLPWFYAGFGFWWTFHLYWTIWVIPREQPDMLENGLELSMLITILMNILILIVVLCCFDVMTPRGYLEDFVSAARQIWQVLCECWQLVQQLVQ